MPNLETEFTELIEKANALGVAAETHDKECSTTCGESDHYCLENRVFIVALVMDRLGLDITEIGYVADKLLCLQSDDGCRPCGDETVDDAPAIDEWPPVVGVEKDN